jgi:hypothetical protein
VVHNGKKVSCWLDTWLDDKPLCVLYPVLYGLCTDKSCSVRKVWSEGWVIRFQTNLPPMIRMQWYELARRLNYIALDEEEDTSIWKWTGSKKFTVKSI